MLKWFSLLILKIIKWPLAFLFLAILPAVAMQSWETVQDQDRQRKRMVLDFCHRFYCDWLDDLHALQGDPVPNYHGT